jgi:hypothetical protein
MAFVVTAIGPSATATGSSPGDLPFKPDCSVSWACLCPWRDVLSLGDFQTLPSAKVPKDVVVCRGQGECEWHLAEQPPGISVYHSRHDLRRDVLPVERHTELDDKAWASEATRFVVDVEDGWIVALNAGEFGGGLYWIARDGSQVRTLNDWDNVAALVKTTFGVVALTGLDHMMPGKGKALLVKKSRAGIWRSAHLADIGASAHAATAAADGAILVVTRTSLVKVDRRGNARVLHRGQWSQFFTVGSVQSDFYPGSVMTGPAGDIFIGMQAAIVHLTPRKSGGYREEWLAPRACVTRARD